MKFNHWIMQKILSSLDHNGCQSNETKQTMEGLTTTITDTFGYRYEIEVRCIGRLSAGNVEKIMEINPYLADDILED